MELQEDAGVRDQLRLEREEAVANWLLTAIAEVDGSLELERSDYGQLAIHLPGGRTYAIQVTEA